MIYGVKFKDKNETLYYDSNNKRYNKNLFVIVDNFKVLEYGKITEYILEPNKDLVVSGNILRKTSKDDYKNYLKNLKDADIALKKAQELANSLELNMRFLNSYYSFDKKQLLLTFTAGERIDFRELTKKLATIYKTRIELRQIGARDKAFMVGGIGPCGKELCCTQFLKDLGNVSISMAKNQNLALNPNKINGCCGRLLCCLSYEDEEYTEMRKKCPKIGDEFKNNNVSGKVVDVNLFKEIIKVQDKQEIKEVNLKNESN